MRDSDKLNILGPLQTPIVVTAALAAIVITLQSQAERPGWRTVSGLAFGVSLLWSVRYVFGGETITTSTGDGVHRHDKAWRRWRLAVFLLPLATGGLFAWTFLPSRQPLRAGVGIGGPHTPTVVFSSRPSGAAVRIARSLYADADPWLEKTDGSVQQLPERTPTSAPLAQGTYRVVFELDGMRLQRDVLVTAPVEVMVDF
jgi:hypothetical protein